MKPTVDAWPMPDDQETLALVQEQNELAAMNEMLARAFPLARPIDFGEHAVKGDRDMRDSSRSYDTPASIYAFCHAEADRLAYWRGEAPEMHLAEPDSAEDTAVRRIPLKHRITSRLLGLPDVSAPEDDEADTEVDARRPC